jgi:hypothetical protein
LEDLGGHWKGQPTELYNQLDSRHKPERAKDLSADLAKAAQRSSTLTFGRGHPERYRKEDGTEGRRRVWELKLTESA